LGVVNLARLIPSELIGRNSEDPLSWITSGIRDPVLRVLIEGTLASIGIFFGIGVFLILILLDLLLICIAIPVALVGAALYCYGLLLWQLAALSITGRILAVILATVPPFFLIRRFVRR
jgi:hypothetical protein